MSLSGNTARAGAAMCTPTVTVPLPRPCTDSASSISVVAESSIENADTEARTSTSPTGGADAAAKPTPWGKFSSKKRFQWNW